ncbi:flavoprotein [Amycolatopsis magusensis]|uniref:flavoprotein n=1 Tax=Amycolatopsis magusensis TaxID=882444 RepID=UPI003C2B09FA
MTGSGANGSRVPDTKRIMLVGTGAPAVAKFPDAVLALRHRLPAARIRLVLTPQAFQFVTPTAVTAVTGQKFFVDRWTEGPYDTAPHVEMAQWAEAVLVHPATLNFIARLASGLADTPLTLALQCTDVPIVLAPSLPPGGVEGYAYRRHLAALDDRPNITVAHPVRGPSMATGRLCTGVPAPFESALDLLHEKLGEVPASAGTDQAH